MTRRPGVLRGFSLPVVAVLHRVAGPRKVVRSATLTTALAPGPRSPIAQRTTPLTNTAPVGRLTTAMPRGTGSWMTTFRAVTKPVFVTRSECTIVARARAVVGPDLLMASVVLSSGGKHAVPATVTVTAADRVNVGASDTETVAVFPTRPQSDTLVIRVPV